MSDVLLLAGVLLVLTPLLLVSLYVYAPAAGVALIVAAVIKDGEK